MAVRPAPSSGGGPFPAWAVGRSGLPCPSCAAKESFSQSRWPHSPSPLPHSPASGCRTRRTPPWTYEWTDTAYATAPTREKVTVKTVKGSTFTLAWTTEDESLENSDDAVASVGTVSFQETNSGVVNTDWSSNAPPAGFPVLCASATQCGNSLASTYYNLIWGSRSPLLAEPLLKGLTWSSTGGAGNDVTSSSTYLGLERLTVPAFGTPVTAAKVRSEITQTGALGDPYGSGIRTVWWVWGVGPVKVVFAHAGGSNAPVTTAVLRSTSLTPRPPPTGDSYFPLVKGRKATYRWTNGKHLAKPVVESVTIADVANGSARFDVASVSGPIQVQGAYGYTLRLDGLTSIWSTTKSASVATFPPLGPKALPPGKRRHFVTPLDLMGFGFNPILPAYPHAGDTWSAAIRSVPAAAFVQLVFFKLAGLLAEREPGAGGLRAAVIVGAGLNVQWAGFPPELAGQSTACNLEAGRVVDRESLLAQFLEQLGRRLDALDAVPSEYRARLATLGRRVRIERPHGPLTGLAVGLRDAGELVVRDDDGTEHVITTADVVHLRPD